MVYRTEKYQKLKSEVERQSKRRKYHKYNFLMLRYHIHFYGTCMFHTAMKIQLSARLSILKIGHHQWESIIPLAHFKSYSVATIVSEMIQFHEISFDLLESTQILLICRHISLDTTRFALSTVVEWKTFENAHTFIAIVCLYLNSCVTAEKEKAQFYLYNILLTGFQNGQKSVE